MEQPGSHGIQPGVGRFGGDEEPESGKKRVCREPGKLAKALLGHISRLALGSFHRENRPKQRKIQVRSEIGLLFPTPRRPKPERRFAPGIVLPRLGRVSILFSNTAGRLTPTRVADGHADSRLRFWHGARQIEV